MAYGNRGIAVRLVYLFVAVLFFIATKIKGVIKPGTIVLCYHGVKDNQRKRFSRQMRMIGRHAVSTTDFCNEKRPVNQTFSICVTFDDALANLISNVLPVITELRIPITIFIATNSLGSLPAWLHGVRHSDSSEMVMTVLQVSDLKENPLISFGSHTSNHPRLSVLREEDIREELRSSRKALMEITHDPIDELALPHGDYSEEVIQIAVEEGYKKIYTLEPLVYVSEGDALNHLVGRFSVTPTAWPIEFFLTINGAYSWLYAWRSFINKRFKNKPSLNDQ